MFCYSYPGWSQENLDKDISLLKEEDEGENVSIRTVS